MRTIKELLEYLDRRSSDIALGHGLCHSLNNLYISGTVCDFSNRITQSEKIILTIYIENNRPHILSSLNAFGAYLFDRGYFWIKGDYKSRRKWLKKHIKINS